MGLALDKIDISKLGSAKKVPSAPESCAWSLACKPPLRCTLLEPWPPAQASYA